MFNPLYNPRTWSNRELKKFAFQFQGSVINVSGWKDVDKEGGNYRQYFRGATEYHISNIKGDYGWSGTVGEIQLDLEHKLPKRLVGCYDVVFNHTTLEHVYNVSQVFDNLCLLSRDIIILVVPYFAAQHAGVSFGDYWRFTPSGIKTNLGRRGLEVIYLSTGPENGVTKYVFVIATKKPQSWGGFSQLPSSLKSKKTSYFRRIIALAPRPRQMASYLRPSRWSELKSKIIQQFYVPSSNWQQSVRLPGISLRQYADYNSYLVHQRVALRFKDVSEYNVKFRKKLASRIKSISLNKSGTVICLGSRLGVEVKAFWDLGYFAIGIDINPSELSITTVNGDMHNLQFPANFADIIYCNCFDHAYNLETVISELKRVLKPGGKLILESIRGSNEGYFPGNWESIWWKKISDLDNAVISAKFKITSKRKIKYPWPGEQTVFINLK